MKRVILGSVVLLAGLCSPAFAQDGGVPPHKLAQLGLGSMRILPDGYADGYHVPPPPVEHIPPPAVEYVEPLPAPGHPVPPIIGMRQFHILQSLRAADQTWLKRNAWRWAHRMSGF